MRRRENTAAAPAPNSRIIGGAGTSVPPLEEVLPDVPPEVELLVLVELEPLVELLLLVELDVLEVMLPEVELELEVLVETLPDELDVEVTLPDEVEVEEPPVEVDVDEPPVEVDVDEPPLDVEVEVAPTFELSTFTSTLMTWP